MSENDRPIKRRRVGEARARLEQPEPADRTPTASSSAPPATSEGANRQLQTAYDSAATDESDMEWEDVDLQQPPQSSSDVFRTDEGGDKPLQITLGQQNNKKGKGRVPRRRQVSAAEKKLRLEIHKVHILCLLGHVQQRNLYCNDRDVHAVLKRMLPKHIIALLNPSEDKAQLTRSTTFMEGLNKACEVFIRKFTVTKPGMRRSYWASDMESLKKRIESIMYDAEVILSKDDFRRQAETLEGSRDLGAQLFSALLRSAGVDARLVCSLQPLPFSGTVRDEIPESLDSQRMFTLSDNHDNLTGERPGSGTSAAPSGTRRLGKPQFRAPGPSQTYKQQSKLRPGLTVGNDIDV